MASAGTDEDPASAIGAIRPDQRIQGRAEDTAAEEQATEAPARGEEAAQAPVTVTDAPPIAPEEPSAAAKATTDTDEIENFAVRRKRLQGRRIKLQGRRNKERRSSRWTAFILVLFAFNVALIGARSEVVRFFPQTASLFAAVGLPVNLRHLKSENMRISKETQEGLSALVIEGTSLQQSHRGASAALRCTRRRRTGNLYVKCSAKPQHSRAWEKNLTSAVALSRRRQMQPM